MRDIDQIEGRLNGELVHKLSNGESVVSYCGIMHLVDKHGISFSLATHDDTNTIIAKARLNGSERVSGKPINGSVLTAGELAKRNAARQLLPYAEVKALELKAKLEGEFDWKVAHAKCCEILPEHCINLVIHDLVQEGHLRQASPSDYSRLEWRMIYVACEKENGKTDPKSLSRWSYNSPAFIAKCRQAINKVREKKKSTEANEMPLENSNGKKVMGQSLPFRKLQMDKKLNTWLVEADGTKKAISCREICEQFESKENSRIVTRLRAGIDSGADISTVEID